MVDSLKKCLAWSELLEMGQANYSLALDPLLDAGLAKRQGRVVIVQNEQALKEIVNSQCREIIRTRNDAQELAYSLGLEVNISSRPQEALALLQELEQNSADNFMALQVQSLSARLFGDSKYIQNIPLLNRIFSQWSKSRHLRGELRLKAFEQIIHYPQGLDLSSVTRAFNQVCIPADKAALVSDFDLTQIDLVLSSENLAPFQQINLPRGLLIFCPGYNTGLSGLWLKSLPQNCQWIHFGDFDPDGLRIFEQLCRQSGRQGRFVPAVTHLEQIKDSLPAWNGSRKFESIDYLTEQAQDLAKWGRTNKCFAEQEQVLRLFGWEKLCL
jgi:hypothetical protein